MLCAAMGDVTAVPDYARVDEVLDELGRDPATLVVLNYPLWDENRVGLDRHLQISMSF